MLILYVSERGREVAFRLGDYFPEASVSKYERGVLEEAWGSSRAFVFVGATGIAVRAIAPFLKDKTEDPAVVVVDEAGRYVISLVSGHIGGANELSREIAALLGATPVVTTATELYGLYPLDTWAKNYDVVFEPKDSLKSLTRLYLEQGFLKVFCEERVPLPSSFKEVSSPSEADLAISYRTLKGFSGPYARPRRLVLGVGFHEGLRISELKRAFLEFLRDEGLSAASFKKVATLRRKASDETLRRFAEEFGLELEGVSSVSIKAVVEEGLSGETAAARHTEVPAVCEPAAIVASGYGRLLVRKRVCRGIAFSVAECSVPDGRLWVVGIGPGSVDHMTPLARRALREADCVVGYKTYLELVKDLVSGKEVYEFNMTQEVERARLALRLASSGRRVAVVSGGDPGVYGMAGVVLELLKEESLLGKVRLEVIPGITAANACASLLGAPLANDFACISLSDRLTPWSVVEKRLRAVAASDLVLVIYNPKSRSRVKPFERACEILLEYRSKDTPVGIVRAFGRVEESWTLTTLGELRSSEVDMQTTLIVGSPDTFVFGPYMITPRGYKGKRY